MSPTTPLPLSAGTRGEHAVELALEQRPIALVLHERSRQRIAQRVPVDAHDGGRPRGIDRFRDADLKATAPESRHELRDAAPHVGRRRKPDKPSCTVASRPHPQVVGFHGRGYGTRVAVGVVS